MSTTLKPFGLKPAFHPSGLDRSTPFAGTNSYTIGTPGYSANYTLSAGQAFYQFTPVAVTSAGALTLAGAATTRLIGSFDGVEFTDSQGRRSVSKWASKTTLDASTEIIFWLFTDPQLVYEIQAVGTIANTAIGKGFDFSVATGYTTADGFAIGNGGAGFSTTALANTAVTAGTGQGQVKVVGLGREVAYPTGELNAWGDTNTIVQVQIANSQLVAPSVSA
jgi:hypothetical protein